MMKNRQLKFIIALCCIVIALGATYAIINVLQKQVQRFTANILATVQSTVTKTTGLYLNYDSIHIDSVSALSVHGISLVREETNLSAQNEPSDGAVIISKDAIESLRKSAISQTGPVVQIDSLTVNFSLWALISGHSDEILRRIVVNTAQIALFSPMIILL